MASSIPRPLSELAPTEKRRNSPSFNQTTKVCCNLDRTMMLRTNYLQTMLATADSSPFQSSPFNASADGNSSPRMFWQGRETTTPNRFNAENLFRGRDSSPSPTRRSSIEKLQRASRVKNSTMFAREMKQEYDPTSVPVIERPLAKQIQGNAYGGSGLDGLRSAERAHPYHHHRNESKTNLSLYSPTQTPTASPTKKVAPGLRSPSKDQASPTKSSMSAGRFNPKSSYDAETGRWSEGNSGDERTLPPGRVLHRHAKSVTFDAAPPQVNEYEMATPDLSSVGTGSRENSYDSAEDDMDDSYNQGESFEQDDSFDASLEDTDKTPVMGPDDWRHDSPDDEEDGTLSQPRAPSDGPEGSPMPDARPTSSLGRPTNIRTDSLNSNGDHRPLPPLPGMVEPTRVRSGSSSGLAAAAERASNSHRGLPSPPAPASVSKMDIQGMGGSKMTLEERLHLMMIQGDDKPKSVAEQQRERRLRRAGTRGSQTPERDVQPISIHEDEDTIDDLPSLDAYQLPPRISRESILRKVDSQITRESDYNFSSPAPSFSPERAPPLDPDTPLPSTESQTMLDEDNESVIIKPEAEDEVDIYDIPDMYQRPESSIGDYYDREDQQFAGDEDAESQYSEPAQSFGLLSHSMDRPNDSDQPTPRANSPINQATLHAQNNKLGLPEFPSFEQETDFRASFQSFMKTSPPPLQTEAVMEAPSMARAHQYLQRPQTPDQRIATTSMPEYDGAGWGSEEDEDAYDVGTPDSVIRHSIPSPPPARDSPCIPEREATIKASGSKLKTRPSATPSDIAAMRELRRNVSGEQPSVPPIPARHRNRPSLNLSHGMHRSAENESELERESSFKKRSLTLDIGSDIGLSLDKDFDRVIEAQKVAFDLSSSTHFDPSNRQASSSDTLTKLYNANITPRKQRGYLMRQNTKLVVASSNIDRDEDNRYSRSCGNSPVKKDRPQSWTVEPWNGQIRKSSIRDRSPRKRPLDGPVPPLPGQESNATGLGVVAEDNSADAAPEENGERGRLFVKVIGVKDLDLPLPKSSFPLANS